VLLRLGAEALVGALERGVARDAGAAVGDGEERVGELALAAREVVGQRLAGALRGVVLIEGVEAPREIVEEGVDRVGDDARAERLHDLEAALDREAREPALRVDLGVEEAFGVAHDLLTARGIGENGFEIGHGGQSLRAKWRETSLR